MQLSYSLFLLLISIYVTYAARKCPTPEDCEEKCLQYARHKLTGCLMCECVPLEGLWEGDMVLADNTKVLLQQALNNKIPKGGVKIVDKWMDFRRKGEWWIPYEYDSSLSMAAKLLIPHAMAEFELKTCLRFHPRRKNQKQYINFFKGDGCFARVGKAKLSEPVNVISLGDRCYFIGTIIHEIMHGAGFFHEQSRTDRDNHVKIHWANIWPGMEHNFQKYNTSVLENYGAPYDFGSIMHYGSYGFALKRNLPTLTDLNDKPITIQREHLSEYDIKQINLMYRCGPERKCRDMKKGKLCRGFAKRGQCKSHPLEAVRECRKSCELCK